MLLLAGSAAAAAQGDGYIRGRVTDDSTGAPLAGVTVMASGAGVGFGRQARTDDSGRFVMRLDLGRYVVRARLLGFIEQIAPPEQLDAARRSVEVELRLLALPTTMPAVSVTARAPLRPGVLEGFERRRSRGVGIFLDGVYVASRGHPPLPDLLRGVAGVLVIGGGRGALVTMSRARRGCYPIVFLDGNRLNWSSDSPESMRALFAMIPGRTVEAVEVYRGMSEAPSEFGGALAPCGALAIWSRPPPAQ